jgi:subtilisin family serine protease
VLPVIDVVGPDDWEGPGGKVGFTGRDGHGHGTHVTGLVLKVTESCPTIRVLPVKALGHQGTGADDVLARGVHAALKWRGSHGERVRVINLSVGSRAPSWVLHDSLIVAQRAGVLVVVASGNRDLAVDYPAAWPEALAVGATTSEDFLAPYSNRGLQLALCAPGGDDREPVPSAWPSYLTVVDRLSRRTSAHVQGYLAGTSMAAPLVSGTDALVWALSPRASATQIRGFLMSHAVPLGPPGPDPFFGAGRLDVARVLEKWVP